MESETISTSKTNHMKRLFSSVLLVAGVLSISDGVAKTTSPVNNSVQTSVVVEMKKCLPINTGATGILTSIVAPSSSLSVTTDMGDVPEKSMREFTEKPELFKGAIMQNFTAIGDELLSLAKAAFDAGIPFSIHLTSSSFADGFTICFLVEERSEAFRQISKLGLKD